MTTPHTEKSLVIDPIRPQRNAVEVFLMALLLWTSAQAVFGQPEPLSVDVLLGRVWAVIWGVGLFGGGVLVLAGLFWPARSLTALSLQQIGYGAFVPMCLARVAALVGVDRADEAFILAVFTFACAVRIMQLEYRIAQFYSVNGHPLMRRLRRRG